MKMTMRWFGAGNDTVTLQHMKQVPKLQGVVGALHKVPVGDIWTIEEISKLKDQVEATGMTLEVIESVNVHEEIKLGSERRDYYIDNYIKTLANLGTLGIKVVCYNFMPIFDWTRTSLAKVIEDGSEVMDYDHNIIERLTPDKIADYMLSESKEFTFPGWEPERLAALSSWFKRYEGFSEDRLRDNLQYFLERIIPVCEKLDIRMAMHPDDPPWGIFGLPRIAKNLEDYLTIIGLVDSEYNGITLCTGCLGACRDNDIPHMIRQLVPTKRVHFVHIRNIRFYDEKSFFEVSHLSEHGNLDMYEVVKALYDCEFSGYVRPDHGRTIWDEKAQPGYGFYDRSLGIAYINGLYEAVRKASK